MIDFDSRRYVTYERVSTDEQALSGLGLEAQRIVLDRAFEYERWQLVERFRDAERLTLVVPAEGTRGWVPRWKSGFYHIARAANVPVVLGFLDYGRKAGGFGPAIRVTGDVRRDMDVVRAFYAGMRGKHHEHTGAILLTEELAEPPAVA